MKISRFWIFFITALIVYGIGEFLIATGRIDSFYENLMITIAINIILAVSLHLVIGITGQLSIGHAGFFAIGAYFSAIFTMNMGLPFPVALILAGIVAAIAGFIVGMPSLRLRGDYLAIATLGFAEIIRIIFLNWEYVGGASGMTVTRMTTWQYSFIFLLITIIVIANFTNSRHGRACI